MTFQSPNYVNQNAYLTYYNPMMDSLIRLGTERYTNDFDVEQLRSDFLEGFMDENPNFGFVPAREEHFQFYLTILNDHAQGVAHVQTVTTLVP